MNRDRNSPMPSGFTPVRVEEPIGRGTPFTAALLDAPNWWIDDAGIDVVGLTPQGEPLLIFPEKLTIPSEIWVTSRGFAVDDWIFFGWSLWLDGNSDRLDAWMDVWNEESDYTNQLLASLIEELNLRTDHSGEEGGTRGARVFLIAPKPDVHIPMINGGYVQDLFDFD